WLKAEGDAVTKAEPLMEVETDKVTVEIEAPAAGTLAGVAASEGDDVPVGQVIAYVLGDGEQLPQPDALSDPAAPLPAAKGHVQGQTPDRSGNGKAAAGRVAEGAPAGARARRPDRGDRRLGAVRRRAGGGRRDLRGSRRHGSAGNLVGLADDGAPDVGDLARRAALLPLERGRRDAA